MNVQYIEAEGIMKVEITIDRTKELPKGAVPALEKELLRRISEDYSGCKLTIHRTGSDGLSVIGGEKSDKNVLKKSCRKRGKVRMNGFSIDALVGVLGRHLLRLIAKFLVARRATAKKQFPLT